MTYKFLYSVQERPSDTEDYGNRVLTLYVATSSKSYVVTVAPRTVGSLRGRGGISQTESLRPHPETLDGRLVLCKGSAKRTSVRSINLI